MKRISKGEYGYISFRRKTVLISTIIMFAISTAIFITGYVTTGTRKNLLTIVAVLGCLPACKSVVNLIMFMRAKGCSEQTKETLDTEIGGESPVLYDLYMTSYEQNYDISQVAIYPDTLLVLLPDADQNIKDKCKEHIESHLRIEGITYLNVTVLSDASKYAERVKKLNEMNRDKTYDANPVINTLLSISL